MPNVPQSCWMHKARSVKEGASALSKAFRSIGSSWNRRWIVVQDKSILYGDSPKDLSVDKKIPFEVISGARVASVAEVRAGGGPVAFSAFGWFLTTENMEVLWAAESAAARDEWVSFILELLQAMRANRTQSRQTFVSGGRSGEGNGTSEASFASRPRSGSHTPSENDDAMTTYGEEDDGGGARKENSRRTQRDLDRLVGGGGDDDDDPEFDYGEDDDEDDDDDDDDDESENGGRDMDNNSVTSSGTAATAGGESREEAEKRRLLAKALTPHNHIEFKMDQYKALLKKHDDATPVCFSRTLAKINKRDTAETRDLVITGKAVYMFSKSTFKAATVRVIEINEIVGVIQSTVEENLLALIVPGFHDILLRITPQNSIVGGTEVEVKQQLVGHLLAALRNADVCRPFILREVPDVRGTIRRSDDDDPLPMVREAGDRLDFANHKNVYSLLRILADQVVHHSTMVLRINAKREQKVKCFCVTESAVYIIHETTEHISRRMPLGGIRKLLIDPDMNGILFQCQEVDTLIVLKNSREYEDIVMLVPRIAKASIGYDLKVVESRHLYSCARLVEVRRLASTVGAGTQIGIKKSMNLTKRLWRGGLNITTKLTQKMGTGVAKVGRGGADLIMTGVLNVGEALVDNTVGNALIAGVGALAQTAHRVLFETTFSIEAEAEQMRVTSATSDTLNLHTAPSIGRWQLGTIYFSCQCKKFNVAAHIDVSKTLERLLVVTERGMVLFEDPTADEGQGVLSTAFSVFRSKKDFVQDECIDVRQWRGLVRCNREPNLVALLTGDEKSTDILIRIPNLALTDLFVRHSLRLYSKHISTPNCRQTLPLFCAVKPDQLRAALKRTQFDPAPTLALCSHPLSDQLALAAVPDVAALLRRYGENAVLFSSIVWRPKDRENKEEGALVDVEKALTDKKHLKSMILVVTRSAIYAVTKGGHEVKRRTELRHITGAVTSTTDPDVVRFRVLGELDILLRVDGRVLELIERVREGAAEWTEYGLYLPGEDPGSHDIAQYTFRVQAAARITAGANLRSTPGQEDGDNGGGSHAAQRSAQDSARSVLASLRRGIEDALHGIKRDAMGAVVAAPERQLPQGAPASWEEYRVRSDERAARVHYACNRAFACGHRPRSLDTLTVAFRELARWHIRRATAQRLTKALAREDVDSYMATLGDCPADDAALNVLLKEQHAAFRSLRDKRHREEQILALISVESTTSGGGGLMSGRARSVRATKPPSLPSVTGSDDTVGSGIESRIDKLEEAMREADALQLHPARVEELKRLIDRELQRSRLRRRLTAMRLDPSSVSPLERETLAAAAVSLGLSAAAPAPAPAAAAPPPNASSGLPFISRNRSQTGVGGSGSIPPGGAVTPPAPGAPATQAASAAGGGSPEAIAVWGRNLLNAVVDTGSASRLSEAIDTVRASAAKTILQPELDDATTELKLLREAEDYNDDLAAEIARVRTSLGRMSQPALRASLEVWRELRGHFARGRALRAKRCVVELYAERVEAAIVASSTEEEAAKAEERAKAEYIERMRVHSDEQQRALDIAAQAEEAERRRRLDEQVKVWTERARRLMFFANSFAEPGDVASATSCIQSSASVGAEIKEIFRSYREADRDHFMVRVDAVLELLKQAARKASHFVDRIQEEERAKRNLNPNAAKLLDVVPDEVLAQVKALNRPAVLAFVRGHQGMMSTRAVDAVRTAWLAAKAEAQWVAQMHHGIHTAVALNSPALLDQQLAVAKEHGNYRDSVVNDAIALYDEMCKKQRKEDNTVAAEAWGRVRTVVKVAVRFATAGQGSNASPAGAENAGATDEPVPHAADGASEVDGASFTSADSLGKGGVGGGRSGRLRPHAGSFFVQPCGPPTMALPAVSQMWNGPPGSAAAAMKALHSAVVAALQSPERVRIEATGDDNNTSSVAAPIRVYLPDDPVIARGVVDAFAGVLCHRVRPTGFFTKTERTLRDVLFHIGQVSVNGDVVAPRTGRLLQDFEKTKKFNTPQGFSATAMLVRFALHKGDVAYVASELIKLSQKEIQELYFQDAALADPRARSDFLSIANAVCSQVQFRFDVRERCDSVAAATLAPPKTSTGRSGAVSPGAGTMGSTTLSLPPSSQTPNSSIASANSSFMSGSVHSPPTQSRSPNAVVASGNSSAAVASWANLGPDVIVPAMRRSLAALSRMFSTELEKLGKRATTAAFRSIFDEKVNRNIGLLVRDEFCKTLMLMFLSGFRSSHLLFKRHPWDFLEASAERIRQSSRDLGGIDIPETFEMVMSLTDPGNVKRTGGALSRLDANELNDVRFRVFVQQALNRGALHGFVESLFEQTPRTAAHLERFYRTDRATLLQPEPKAELLRVLKAVSALPFVLCIDAELW